MSITTLFTNTTNTTDYVFYGEEYKQYNLTLNIVNSGSNPISYSIIANQDGKSTTISEPALSTYGNGTITISLGYVTGRIGIKLINPYGNTLSASLVDNQVVNNITLTNYSPLSLPAGTATDIIAAATTLGIKTVPPLIGKTLKFWLNYNLWCPTASTTWALTLKLGTNTLYTGSTTGQQQNRNLEFILDQTNNFIYIQRNTILDNAVAMLVTKVAFSDWLNPQALSLTVKPTAAGQVIGLDAGYSE